MGSFFLFLSFGKETSPANDISCSLSPYKINPSLNPDRFYSPLPLTLREAWNILMSSMCSWEPSLKIVHLRTNDGNAFRKGMPDSFSRWYAFRTLSLLKSNYLPLPSFENRTLQTRILSCTVISKSLFTFWYPTHCFREMFLKDAHMQKKSCIADHAETIKRCVNDSGKMSSNCEIWKEEGNMEGSYLSLEMRLSNCKFGSSIVRELTSLLPLEFRRS